MTTKAQRASHRKSLPPTVQVRNRALSAIASCGSYGATYDEAYARAYPARRFTHGEVDTFRVVIRKLREEGLVMDSGQQRPNRVGNRKQTVWVLGDDRVVVEAHRRKKLELFPTSWLVDELKRR